MAGPGLTSHSIAGGHQLAMPSIAYAATNAITEARAHFSVPPSSKTRCKDFPLYDADVIYDWQKGNPFIRSYYRCNYTTKQCIKSVFAMHNETANIWTHAIGFIIAFVLSVHVLLHLGLGRAQDYGVFFVFELGSLMMLGGSSVYHTLSGHHCEKVHNFALALDYFGITSMIVGSFYPIVYYLFACAGAVRNAYLISVTLVGLLGLIGPFFSFFNTPQFYWPRLLLYVALTATGVFPIAHLHLVFPSNDVTTPLYYGVSLMLGIYLFGMVIYILKIPERWYPGCFDVWLHSHQLWHYLVLAAAVVHYFTCMGAFQLWSVTGEVGGECR